MSFNSLAARIYSSRARGRDFMHDFRCRRGVSYFTATRLSRRAERRYKSRHFGNDITKLLYLRLSSPDKRRRHSSLPRSRSFSCQVATTRLAQRWPSFRYIIIDRVYRKITSDIAERPPKPAARRTPRDTSPRRWRSFDDDDLLQTRDTARFATTRC